MQYGARIVLAITFEEWRESVSGATWLSYVVLVKLRLRWWKGGFCKIDVQYCRAIPSPSG